MDRFLKIWVESARVSSSFDDSSSNSHCSPPIHQRYLSRPPPLRTSSTYDDDEAFNNVALNLLSRYESLGLTAQEAIIATLIDNNQRASFYEGLCYRLDRSSHLSPNTSSLVKCIYQTLGKELKDLVTSDSKSGAYFGNKPVTPRSNVGYCRNVKQLVQRRFFPENNAMDKQSQQMVSPSLNGSVGAGVTLFGNNKRRVQNIDWKMAEAIQQVNHLRLDGTSPITQQMKHVGVYEPPTAQRGI
jgi:Zn-dependent oligopeptidase